MMVTGVLTTVPNIAAYSRIQQISSQINNAVSQRLIAKSKFEPMPIFEPGVGRNINIII